ncbi:hypothetical protein HDE_08678 [Halotydeus destructor]|nr:hypothetical protein HDE_08678 [Halotydeus destructor]
MDDYYIEQAGSGLGFYRGDRYQKGHGLMSGFLGTKLLPLIKRVLPYIGRQAFEFGSDIVNDIGLGSENIGNSVRKAARKRAASITEDALVKVRDLQGSGGKRRRMAPKAIKRRKAKAKPRRNLPAKRRRVIRRKKKTASDYLF